MDKEKAKKILENMLMNDAPMQIIGFAILESIRDGYNPSVEYGVLNRCKQEDKALQDIYGKIDISKLDEETGKSIVEECQPLVREFYDQYSVLLDRYIRNDFQSQEVPQRLFKIRERVIAASKEYAQLEACALYQKAWSVGYFSENSKSRMQWFIDGKPTEIHPEKLELVLENESTKTICR